MTRPIAQKRIRSQRRHDVTYAHVGVRRTSLWILLMVLSTMAASSDAAHARRRRPASPKELMARAERQYQRVEYDRVLRLTKVVLDHPGTDDETRLKAYWLQGCVLAIIGDHVAAETPFRRLLELDSGFEPTDDVPPKITAVYRKVQADERAAMEQEEKRLREKTMEKLDLFGEGPAAGRGGMPLAFSYELRDPDQAIERLSLHFRRQGESAYSTLALSLGSPDTARGMWKAEIPAAWTENDTGFVLEYYLTTHDGRGSELLTVGDPVSPRTVNVTAGRVPRSRPYYETIWFWAATMGALTACASGYLLYQRARALPAADGYVKVK